MRENPRLAGSIWGAAGALLVLAVAVRQRAQRAGRVLRYDFLPKPVHYVQLTMHTSIYVYWGWYWREVYHYAPLIVAQIVFVYVLDMLVCWWRRDTWILGFGPFPIVFSTNLFLWFRDDWFYLQFLMIATGGPLQGVPHLGARRTAHAHLQPVGHRAGDLFGRDCWPPTARRSPGRKRSRSAWGGRRTSISGSSRSGWWCSRCSR